MRPRNFDRYPSAYGKLIVQAVILGLAVTIALAGAPAAAMGSAPLHQITTASERLSSREARPAIAAKPQIGSTAKVPAVSRSYSKRTAARKTAMNMQPMPCMSEMRAMMASMRHMHHTMSMREMQAMMASMHLPRQATHAQCMRAIQTMMAKMHPQRQAQPMRAMQIAAAAKRRTRMKPQYFAQALPCR
jgi:hypothetical protein